MSSIGLEEVVAEHDELTLVSVNGGDGRIYDCDGDDLFSIPAQEVEAVAAIFPLLVRAYRTGHKHGEKWGMITTLSNIRHSLGITP